MNVNNTYANKLCCSCGVCEGICPKNAISLTIDNNGFFKPEINNECIQCGICYRYCPGINYLEPYNDSSEKYVYGYSNLEHLRKNASSGGMGTQLVMYLIETKIVDYAVVVKEEKNGNFEAIITNDLDKIYESKGSKYCPIKIGEVVRKIIEMDAKFVIVGTPCKIQALKKYFYDYKMEHKIKYYFSLFCNNVPSLNATEYLLTMYGHNNVDTIVYRGGGWPGYIQIKENNKIYIYPYRKTMSLGFIKNFKCLRCLICTDPFGREADISFGDAYFINESDDKLGNTFCIVRNQELVTILNMMKNDKIITLKIGPSIEKITDAYFGLFNRKRNAIRILSYMDRLGICIPNNSPIERKRKKWKFPIFTFFRLKYNLFITNLSKHKWLWPLLFRSKRGKKIILERNVVILDDKL